MALLQTTDRVTAGRARLARKRRIVALGLAARAQF